MKSIPSKILIFFFSFLFVTLNTSCSDQKEGGSIFPVSRTENASSGGIEEYSFSDIASDAAEHVVNISTKRMVRRAPFALDPRNQQYPGPDIDPRIPSEQLESSLGSGVFIGAGGIVVTNYHVIEGAVDIRATCNTKRQFKVTVIGTDPSTDLAVVRLEGDCGDMEPIPFGDSDKVRVGDMVLAAGNPFALTRSVSMGIVSALQRANFGEVEYENFIQTDAAINPGNSGGALVNMRGELIGINSAILSQTGGSVGIAFSIPSNMVRQVVESILKSGKIVHGTLGIAIQKVDQDVIDAFNLSTDKGVIVTDVTSGSPGQRAGLKSEDVVLKVDEEEISRRNQFRNRIAFTPPGTKVRLTILRQGKTMTLDATIGEKPQAQVAAPGTLQPKPGGLAVADLDMSLRRQIGVPDEIPGKVIVMQVEPGSVADVSGFNPGDIILEVDHKPVTSLSQYKDVYQAASGNVLFLIRRPDGFYFRLMRNTR